MLYRDVLKVKEYFLFYPSGDYLKPQYRKGIPCEKMTMFPSRSSMAGCRARCFNCISRLMATNCVYMIRYGAAAANSARGRRASGRTCRARRETCQTSRRACQGNRS